MAKLNRQVTGPDNVTRYPGEDVPSELETAYRNMGLLDEGDENEQQSTDRNLARMGTNQMVAGEDPYRPGSRDLRDFRFAGPGGRGSAPDANDAGLAGSDNVEITRQQTELNRNTVTSATEITPTNEMLTGEVESKLEAQPKMQTTQAPNNKARTTRSTK